MTPRGRIYTRDQGLLAAHSRASQPGQSSVSPVHVMAMNFYALPLLERVFIRATAPLLERAFIRVTASLLERERHFLCATFSLLERKKGPASRAGPFHAWPGSNSTVRATHAGMLSGVRPVPVCPVRAAARPGRDSGRGYPGLDCPGPVAGRLCQAAHGRHRR